jgi:hypothetical protein
MERLKLSWLTEGLMDFEYKRYILLAYLKGVRNRFDRNELYPFLSELITHYQNLVKIKENKEILIEKFPKTLTKADFKKLKLSYELVVKDDEMMQLLEEMIEYSMPLIDGAIKDGKELFDFVRDNIELGRVGLTPLYKNEGYLFINQEASKDVTIYRYGMNYFSNFGENYQGISTTFITEDVKGISRTYEAIKLDLVRHFKDLPNPNTFIVESRIRFPLPQTLLPVVKRLLILELNGKK